MYVSVWGRTKIYILLPRVLFWAESEILGYRAAVVGCGAQGRVVSALLAQDPEISELGLFDLRPDQCRTHVGSLGDVAAKVTHVGALDAANSEEAGRLLRGYDVVVNAVVPRFNLSLMKACVTAQAHYVDMAFGPPYSNLDAQLGLSRLFGQAGLVGLVGAGKSPGLTNLLVAEAADMLDSVFAVRIRLYEETYSSEPLMTWSPKTFLEDCAIPPSHIRDGLLVRSPPFSGEEEYVFPVVGKRRVWLHEHEESYMFQRTLSQKGLKTFDLKMGGLEKIKALYDLGLLRLVEDQNKGPDRIELLASLLPQPPSQAELLEKIGRGAITGSVGITVVEAEGFTGGRQAKVTMWAEDPSILDVVKVLPMATADSYVVGATCYLLVKALLDEKPGPGVYLPEELPQNTRRRVLELLGKQKPPIRVCGRLEESVSVAVRQR